MKNATKKRRAVRAAANPLDEAGLLLLILSACSMDTKTGEMPVLKLIKDNVSPASINPGSIGDPELKAAATLIKLIAANSPGATGFYTEIRKHQQAALILTDVQAALRDAVKEFGGEDWDGLPPHPRGSALGVLKF